MLRVAVLALALAACVEPNLVTCADGRACPGGTVCDEAHTSCVAPGQLTACVDAAQFASCDAVTNGRCFDGVCLPAGCGNDQLEPEEVCDDGNTLSGDGCSADCTSGERCGDGVVDASRGEQCDDENALAYDGCTAACTSEELTWRTRVPPPPRWSPTVGYDPGRRRFVMFGGQTDVDPTVLIGDTWWWDGVTWIVSQPLLSPSPRADGAMAYDPVRGRLVMFGGLGPSGPLNDTWEYDGETWTRMTSDDAVPPARRGHSMAWDPISKSIIMYGGSVLVGFVGDTWRWNGHGWSLVQPASSPIPGGRMHPMLVTNPKLGRIVLLGGYNDVGDLKTDVYTFDGTSWISYPTSAWSGTFIGSAVYEPDVDGIVVRGGNTTELRTWVLENGAWQTQLETNAALPLGDLGMYYDLEQRHIYTVMGSATYDDGQPDTATGNVFELDGLVWNKVDPGFAAPSRYAPTVIADPSRGTVVSFGGGLTPTPSSGVATQTALWNGQEWKDVSPTTSPPGRELASGGWVPWLDEAVLFGGVDNAQVPLADTWGWNGTTWNKHDGVGPFARAGAGFAVDTDRHRVVLFGGIATGDNASSDTWEWDGTTWTRMSPPTSPSARVAMGMAYDPVHHRVVLHGGAPSLTQPIHSLDDTWTWDGTTWTQLTTTIHPESRFGHVLFWDPERKRLHLGGGELGVFSSWELDGDRWTAVSTILQPAGVLFAGAAYDAVHRQIVLVGGGLTSLNSLVWTGGWRGDLAEGCDSGRDLDGDGKVGCADEDCAGRCGACGDGTCSALENERLCAADCNAPPVCGDYFCAPGETCPGDCF